ncbi:hypothetical protein J6E39_02965 [bacterium]|nr:hypothetical protein [bacterium]
MQNNNIPDIQYLEYRIEEALQNNKPIDKYILQEIQWLKNQLEIFLEQSTAKGNDIDNDVNIAEIKIRQYAKMKQLAQKANLPVAEYDEKIKQVQITIFGEEGYKQFFAKN